MGMSTKIVPFSHTMVSQMLVALLLTSTCCSAFPILSDDDRLVLIAAEPAFERQQDTTSSAVLPPEVLDALRAEDEQAWATYGDTVFSELYRMVAQGEANTLREASIRFFYPELSDDEVANLVTIMTASQAETENADDDDDDDEKDDNNGKMASSPKRAISPKKMTSMLHTHIGEHMQTATTTTAAAEQLKTSTPATVDELMEKRGMPEDPLYLETHSKGQ